MGVSSEQLGRLFQPFAQADDSMSRRFGGSGLGLSISQRLARMLGGELSVRSQPGQGSVFSFEVATGPLDTVRQIEPDSIQRLEGRAQAQAGAGSPSARSLEGVRILLAEDGPDNQRLIAYVLRREGAEVTIVDNGRKAVEALAPDNAPACLSPPPFDVVLMDMQMPEMDGYTATALLRAKGATLPIVALTAHAMAGERERCLAAGCSDYATKPIDRAALIQTVLRPIARPAAPVEA
jgi:CheY-like chemotaxis protein